MPELRPGGRGAGAEGRGVAGAEGLAAGLADHLRGHLVAAVVLEDQRRAVVAGQVLVAPAHQRDDDGVQVAARGGQVVLEPGRVLAVAAPLEDPGAGQGAEPGRQRVARRPGRRTISSNRRLPRKTSRTASSAHFSPTRSSVRAIEQGRGSAGVLVTNPSVPGKSVFWTHS